MSSVSEFRSAVEVGREKILKLEKVRAAHEREGRSYENKLCLSAIDGCKKACSAAENLIKSGKLESLDSLLITNSVIEMFQAFMSVANFHLKHHDHGK